MIHSIHDFNRPYFIGIAGSGMSAIAQYLKGLGKAVSGSDRFFKPGEYNETRAKLEAGGITCYPQDGEGLSSANDLVVVSAAVEDTVVEVQKAKQLNIPIMKRSELLALVAASKRTIAVAGTSGKSTTAAMLFDILGHAGLQPSIISGAGLVSIIREGKIGNAKVGRGEWLVIEADESDGSIVEYKPALGLLLNIDKDHKDIDTLIGIFETFRSHCADFIVNRSHPLSRKLSRNADQDFSVDDTPAGYMASGFSQQGFNISFELNGILFELALAGRHNMENAVAAATAAARAGVDLATSAEALRNYEGIYRRHQLLGKKQGVYLVDDYAHNPVKCAAAIAACQPVASKVIAWFQPHGYGPTKFLRHDFVKEIGAVLRPQDEIWMSEIFYAGGTTTKDISAADLIRDLAKGGRAAHFVADRNQLLAALRPHLTDDCVLLLMGARDPSLEKFAKEIWETL